MAPPNPPPPAGPRRFVGILLGAGVLLLALTGAAITFVRVRSQAEAPLPPPVDVAQSLAAVPAYAINTPRTYAASQVTLADQEEVLGVTLGGKHRAYCVRALGGSPMHHVLNDVLGDSAVSVIHCDRSRCTKVVTAEQSATPLKVAFGGWMDEQMMIRTGEGVYYQRSLYPAQDRLPPFPYPELPYERTTWKAWREAHPDTDVYIGGEEPIEAHR